MSSIAHSNKKDRNVTIFLKDDVFTPKLIKDNIINNSENFNTSDIDPTIDLIMKSVGNKCIPNSEYTFNLRFNNLGELYIFNICINLNTIE